MNSGIDESTTIFCFFSRHKGKFLTALLAILLIISTTLYSAQRFRAKSESADQLREVIADCTVPGPNPPPRTGHRCYDDGLKRQGETLQRLITQLAIDNDCRLRRTLEGLPAPEKTDEQGRIVPCPDQTPTNVYPGDGTKPQF